MRNVIRTAAGLAFAAFLSVFMIGAAQAKYISVAFEVKGLVYNYWGHPHCFEGRCEEWQRDATASGSIVMFDKNNDGHIGQFEWVSFKMSWPFNTERGMLPLDFDPSTDLDPVGVGEVSLSIDYFDVFDGDGSDGRLVGDGYFSVIGRDGAGVTFDNGKLSFSSYPMFNVFWYSTDQSYIWSEFVYGDQPPSPVPLPAAGWFLLSGLAVLLGLRRFNRTRTQHAV